MDILFGILLASFIIASINLEDDLFIGVLIGASMVLVLSVIWKYI